MLQKVINEQKTKWNGAENRISNYNVLNRYNKRSKNISLSFVSESFETRIIKLFKTIIDF